MRWSPFLAVQARRARAEHVGAGAVVAAPVVADGGQQPGVGALFVLVVLAGGGDLLHPVLGQSLVGEYGGQGAPGEAGIERAVGLWGDCAGVAQGRVVGQRAGG
ncbi:hypothetical protein, partial [Streptomyces sp. NRRL WC-3605]|uniref:hypothetical protein n=2 Tax=unclassified Streptomyces TaxID=2593676 RepID=UPI00131BE07C